MAVAQPSGIFERHVNETPSLMVDVQLAFGRFELETRFSTEKHVTGVFGSSGAGKSSLLETIAGLQRRARGVVRFGADEWQNSETKRFVPPERRGVGYVPQDGLLFPHRNVRKNLLSGARRTGHANSVFDQVVDFLKLTSLLERGVSTLSGGERQRVALGRALCSAPRLLLLDEPLASLDLPLRRTILPFLRGVRERFDAPMLLVSHDPIEVQALCDDLIVLREGRIVARGAPHDVLTNPEVFPIAKEEGFENILPGTLVETGEGRSRVRLGAGEGAVELQTPPVDGDTGAAVVVSVPARDILIATSKPAGLSARNIFPARVSAIVDLDGPRLVHLQIAKGLPDLAVELTARAVDELELAPGRDVFAVVKASSCTVYA